jgi:Amidase
VRRDCPAVAALHTAGVPTCRRPARRDCSAVAALRAAGAVLIGKTNMHELGFSTIGINPHYGVCRNPWDTRRVCGGSSSGAALERLNVWPAGHLQRFWCCTARKNKYTRE